jgi:alpha-L-fucosidase
MNSASNAYEPAWESLLQHKTPEWLLDAKFGIYAHWGLYAVPAFGNEWYAKRMYDAAGDVYEEHCRRFGDPAKFGYKDFIPQFTAERYDPGAWADLAVKSGARYAGFSLVHHDGFALWDSDVTRWNAGKMGPKRDLYGEFVTALRKHEMKIVAPFHLIRCFDWYLPGSPEAVEKGRQAGWDLFDPEYADFYWNRFTGKFEDFIRSWRDRVNEVTDKYNPDILWFDGGKFQEEGSAPYALDVLSHFLNTETPDKPVEALNKLPTSMKFNFPREFGVWTFEDGRDRPVLTERPWIDDMKIGDPSWGYVEGQTYLSAKVILHGLIDRVSRGGGLLLSLSPKADGTIPQGQQDALLGVGKWLEANGEAVYATRPWKAHAEGGVDKLIARKPKHPKWQFDNCGPEDIRYTQSKDGKTIYAIALGRPGKTLKLPLLGKVAGLLEGEPQSVRMIGVEAESKWTRDEDCLTIDLEGVEFPDDVACAWRIVVK